jgi:hypothetical protein
MLTLDNTTTSSTTAQFKNDAPQAGARRNGFSSDPQAGLRRAPRPQAGYRGPRPQAGNRYGFSSGPQAGSRRY